MWVIPAEKNVGVIDTVAIDILLKFLRLKFRKYFGSGPKNKN